LRSTESKKQSINFAFVSRLVFASCSVSDTCGIVESADLASFPGFVFISLHPKRKRGEDGCAEKLPAFMRTRNPSSLVRLWLRLLGLEPVALAGASAALSGTCPIQPEDHVRVVAWGNPVTQAASWGGARFDRVSAAAFRFSAGDGAPSEKGTPQFPTSLSTFPVVFYMNSYRFYPQLSTIDIDQADEPGPKSQPALRQA